MRRMNNFNYINFATILFISFLFVAVIDANAIKYKEISFLFIFIIEIFFLFRSFIYLYFSLNIFCFSIDNFVLTFSWDQCSYTETLIQVEEWKIKKNIVILLLACFYLISFWRFFFRKKETKVAGFYFILLLKLTRVSNIKEVCKNGENQRFFLKSLKISIFHNNYVTIKMIALEHVPGAKFYSENLFKLNFFSF